MEQQDLSLLCDLPEPVFVPRMIVTAQKDGREALRNCLVYSGWSQNAVADELNIDHGHFSRIMQGKAHMPENKRERFMRVCGNLLPMQFEMYRLGVVPAGEAGVTEEQLRIRQLENQLREERTLHAA